MSSQRPTARRTRIRRGKLKEQIDSFFTFPSFLPSQFTVRVGEWDLSDQDNYSIELPVTSIIAHPNFRLASLLPILILGHQHWHRYCPSKIWDIIMILILITDIN